MKGVGVSLDQVKALWAKVCDFMKGRCRYCGQFLSLRNPVCQNINCQGQGAGQLQCQPQSWPYGPGARSMSPQQLAADVAEAQRDRINRAGWAAINARDAHLRVRAVDTLGRVGDARNVPTLTRTLCDGDAEVRQKSVEALARIGSPQAVPALLQALRADRDQNVRWRAAAALGDIRDARVVPALTRALRDRDYRVRFRAAEALGKAGNRQSVRALIDTFHNDADWRVRREAARALGKIGGQEAVSVLLRRVQDGDRNRHVYDAAVAALERAITRR